MQPLTLIVQNLIRLVGVTLIVLGFVFWSHHAYNLVPLHRWLGVALVVLLWILAFIALSARVSAGLAMIALAWGLLVVFFGFNMGGMLPGRAHEAIRVLHFLIGLFAIALGEMLGARIKRKGQLRVS